MKAIDQNNINERQFVIANRPNLTIGRVEYVYPEGATISPPLTPHTAKSIRVYIINIGNHPVHIYNYKFKAIFDTNTITQDLLIDQMKGGIIHPINWYVPTGTKWTRNCFSRLRYNYNK